MVRMISWTDGIYGEERSARGRREAAAQNLRQADRVLRYCRWLPVWFAVSISYFIVRMAISPDLDVPAAVAIAVQVFAALMWTTFGLPYPRQVAAERRDKLALVQAQYDEVFARMLAWEAAGCDVTLAAAEASPMETDSLGETDIGPISGLRTELRLIQDELDQARAERATAERE